VGKEPKIKGMIIQLMREINLRIPLNILRMKGISDTSKWLALISFSLCIQMRKKMT